MGAAEEWFLVGEVQGRGNSGKGVLVGWKVRGTIWPYVACPRPLTAIKVVLFNGRPE